MGKNKDRTKVRLLANSGQYRFPCGTVLTPLNPVGEIDTDLVDKLSYVEAENAGRDQIQASKLPGRQTPKSDAKGKQDHVGSEADVSE